MLDRKIAGIVFIVVVFFVCNAHSKKVELLQFNDLLDKLRSIGIHSDFEIVRKDSLRVILNSDFLYHVDRQKVLIKVDDKSLIDTIYFNQIDYFVLPNVVESKTFYNRLSRFGFKFMKDDFCPAVIIGSFGLMVIGSYTNNLDYMIFPGLIALFSMKYCNDAFKVIPEYNDTSYIKYGLMNSQE